MKKDDKRGKTLFELVNGKKPYATNDEGIRNKPITDFIAFSEAQSILGHKWRGSTENMLYNGSIRYMSISPEFKMIRMIYKPDVIKMRDAILKHEKESA